MLLAHWQLLKKHPHVAAWEGWEELPDNFWPKPAGPSSTAETEVAGRIGEFKQWLLARPEACFALIGHSAWFRTMTGMAEKLENCEAFWCILTPDGSVVPAPVLPPPPSADED